MPVFKDADTQGWAIIDCLYGTGQHSCLLCFSWFCQVEPKVFINDFRTKAVCQKEIVATVIEWHWCFIDIVIYGWVGDMYYIGVGERSLYGTRCKIFT